MHRNNVENLDILVEFKKKKKRKAVLTEQPLFREWRSPPRTGTGANTYRACRYFISESLKVFPDSF